MKNKQIKMLMVDDKSVTSLLDRSGYREVGIMVYSSHDEPDTIKTLNSKEIDLIVLNSDYPGIQTPALIRRIREIKPQGPQIIATSVQTSQKVRENLLNNGADLFVQQPIPRSYFIEQVKQLLEQQTRENSRVSTGIGSVHVFDKANKIEKNYEIADISSGGMLISFEGDMIIGAKLELSFKVGDNHKTIEATGEVVRNVKPNASDTSNNQYGVGVRFISFKQDGQKTLKTFLEQSKLDQNHMQFYL